MASLTFVESIKDKASRLSGNPFSPYVEEATSDLLLVQDQEKIAQLVQFGNQGGDHVSELLNAVRRRIDHKNPKVQCFTVVVLDALIRHCGRDLHVELATNQKALLHELVLLAAKEPQREAEFRARELAATLIVNCSFWFAHYPDDRVRSVLTTLVDYCCAAGGNLDNITPDTDFRVRVEEPRHSTSINEDGSADPPPSRPQRTRELQASAPRQADGGRGRRSRGNAQVERSTVPGSGKGRVVEAIPVESPSEDQLNGMLEAVIVMVDCLNQTEAHGPLSNREILLAVAAQVREQHEHISSLLAVAQQHGLDLANRDTLQSICDSQVEVLNRYTEIALHQNTNATAVGNSTNRQEALDDDESAAIQASLETARAEQQLAAQQPPSVPLGTYRDRLQRYYEFYNPGKMTEIDAVLAKFEGREEQMMRQLRAKYGPEPMPPQEETAQPRAHGPQPSVQPHDVQPAVPVQAPPTIDELFAATTDGAPSSASADKAAGSGTSTSPAPRQTHVDPFSALQATPIPEAARKEEVGIITSTPPSSGDHQTNVEPSETQPQPPKPSVAQAAVVAQSAYPKMGQNMDPRNQADRNAMLHSDGPSADTAAGRQAAGDGGDGPSESEAAERRPPEVSRDDDFDAFLNARLSQ